MNTCRTFILLLAFGLFPASPVHPSPTRNAAADARIIAEATGGQFKASKGRYFEKACNESLAYEAEVVDLNGDGQPEVFTTIQGTCMGGMAGSHLNLYIRRSDGRWKPQFGFPGMYTILKTMNKGYPDIEIGGPGFCFPVWRWNGREYALHRQEYEGKPCRRRN